MSMGSIFLSCTMAILAIVVTFAVVLPYGSVSVNEVLVPMAILVAVGVSLLGIMLAWARGRGRDVVEPVAARFNALLLAVGAVFSTTVHTIGRSGATQPEVEPWLVIALALLVLCLGWISAGIGRNRFIGFRTRRSLASNEAWRSTNRRFGRALIALSPLSLLGLLAGPYGPLIAIAPALVVGFIFLWSDACDRH